MATWVSMGLASGSTQPLDEGHQGIVVLCVRRHVSAPQRAEHVARLLERSRRVIDVAPDLRDVFWRQRRGRAY